MSGVVSVSLSAEIVYLSHRRSYGRILLAVHDEVAACLHAFKAAHITLDQGRIGRKILNRIAGDRNHPRSGRGQTPDDRASNAARSSGDQRASALQLIWIVYERLIGILRY
jgi:hypothetical protein